MRLRRGMQALENVVVGDEAFESGGRVVFEGEQR